MSPFLGCLAAVLVLLVIDYVRAVRLWTRLDNEQGDMPTSEGQ